jgi:cell division protein FtsL
MKFRYYLDFFIILLFLIGTLWAMLLLNSAYTELSYKHNREYEKFTILNNEIKSLKIQEKQLSSPERIINYAQKNLGLRLPKLYEVYHIEAY